MTYFNPLLSFYPIDNFTKLTNVNFLPVVGVSANPQGLDRCENLVFAAIAIGYVLTIPFHVIMTIWNTVIAVFTSALSLLTFGQVKSINEYAVKAWKDAFCELYSSIILAIDLPVMIVCHVAGAIFEPSAGIGGWEVLKTLATPLKTIDNCWQIETPWEAFGNADFTRPNVSSAIQPDLVANEQSFDQRLINLEQRVQAAQQIQNESQKRVLEETLKMDELTNFDPSLRMGHIDQSQLVSILDRALFSDVKLKVIVKANIEKNILEHSAEFSAHKVILFARSEAFFEQMMPETPGEIQLRIEDPKIIKNAENKRSVFDKFLYYLYSLSTDFSNLSVEELWYISSLANQFRISSLEDQSRTLLLEKINSDISLDNLLAIMERAIFAHIEDLREACLLQTAERINVNTSDKIHLFANKHNLESLKVACRQFREGNTPISQPIDNEEL